MTIIERLNEEIKEAIRNQNKLRMNTLRMLKSKILAANARGDLPEADVLKLFKTYFGNLQEALDQAQTASRPEIVEQLKSEILIVQEFLPQALSAEETKKLVEQAIVETGAKSKKEFGLVMKTLMKLNNNVDGKVAKALADQLLSD